MRWHRGVGSAGVTLKGPSFRGSSVLFTHRLGLKEQEVLLDLRDCRRRRRRRVGGWSAALHTHTHSKGG